MSFRNVIYFSLYNNFKIIVILLWKRKFHPIGKRKLLKTTYWHFYLHIRAGQPVKILEKEKTTNIQLKEIIVSNYILRVFLAVECKSPITTTSTTLVVNKVCFWPSASPKKELKKSIVSLSVLSH